MEELVAQMEKLDEKQRELTVAHLNLEKHVNQLTADVHEIKQALGSVATKADIEKVGAKLDATTELLRVALRSVPLGAVVATVAGMLVAFSLFVWLLLGRL